MTRETIVSKSDWAESCGSTIQSGNSQPGALYLHKPMGCMRRNLNEAKQIEVQKCCLEIYSSQLIPSKDHRSGQIYYLWLESVQIKRSLKCIICLNSSGLKHPQRAIPQWAKILAEDYRWEYYFMEKVVSDFSKENNLRKDQYVQVQHLLSLNPYCFRAARKLLQHQRMDIEALLENEDPFQYSKVDVRLIHQLKIKECLLYLYQRLHHANGKAQEIGYYQKIKNFAYQFGDLKNYKFIKDVFLYLDKIRDEICKIRQEVYEMLNSKEINHQILIQFCEFIGKLQGPKHKGSQCLLFELQHYKTVYQEFKPTSQYREKLKNFIVERMKQIRYIIFTEMKFKINNSRQLQINTHGHRFQQLEQLFEQLSVVIVRWNKNGELTKVYSNKKNEQIIDLKVQQGIGNHTDRDRLTILKVLDKFKKNKKQWYSDNWRLKVDHWYVNQNHKDILQIKLSLKKITSQI